MPATRRKIKIQVLKAECIEARSSMLNLSPQQANGQDIQESPDHGARDDQDQGKRKRRSPVLNCIREHIQSEFGSLLTPRGAKMGVSQSHPEENDEDKSRKKEKLDVLQIQ
jgi:hypothetical protein